AINAVIEPLTGEPLTEAARLHALFKAALVASEVCSNHSFDSYSPASRQSDNHVDWTGDPLDVLIANHFRELFGSPLAVISETRRHFPFDLLKRREAGLFQNGTEVLLAVKGAWES